MDTTENERVARRFAEAVTAGDRDAAVGLCHPDVEFQSVLGLTGRAYIGHDGIREYFEDAESAWEQWDVEIEQVTEAADGRVAIVMTMHARGKESGAGLAQRTAHVWTLRDGKLAGNQPYRDPELALQTLGLPAV